MFLGVLKQNLIFKHKEITQLNMQNKLQHNGTTCSSTEAVRMDFLGLRLNDWWIRSLSSSEVLGLPLLGLCSNVPVSINCLCQLRIDWRAGACFAYYCVISLCLNIRFCFNKPRNTLCFFLWSNHFYKAWKSIILFFKFISEIKKWYYYKCLKTY